MEARVGYSWQRSDLRSLGRCQGGGLRDRRWKVDGEGCAFVGAAFDLEHAAVAIDDVLDDRESQAGAAEAARPPAVDAVEPLGEARDMLALDPLALVGHRHLESGPAESPLAGATLGEAPRSAERRVGQEGVSTCRSRR